MKKILLSTSLFIVMALISVVGVAQIFQSDFETWTAGKPNGWFGSKTTISIDSIGRDTVNVHGGTSACRLIRRASTHVRFSTQPLYVDSGTIYTISFWVRGNGSIRTGIYDGRAGTSSGYGYGSWNNMNTTTWTQIMSTDTAKKTTSYAEFILSLDYTEGDLEDLQVDDYSITSSNPAPFIYITSPSYNATVYGSSTNVGFLLYNFKVGPSTDVTANGHIHCKVDNGTPTSNFTTAPISLTGLTAGNHTITLSLVDTFDVPLAPAITDSVVVNVNLTPVTFVSIHDIQYTTNPNGESPYNGQIVRTGGIVTASKNQKYCIQNGSGPWSGVYVFDLVNSPSVGDSVVIIGTVYEYLSSGSTLKFTEIKTISSYNFVSSGNAVPEPLVVTIPDARTENYESVLIRLVNVTCSGTPDGFYVWTLTDGTNSLKVDDDFYNFAPTLNSVYTITGIGSYSFNEWKILPRAVGDVVAGVSTISIDNSLSIYPNPVADNVTFENIKGVTKIKLSTIIGTTVKTVDNIKTENLSINIGDLKPGIYMVTLYNNNQIVKTTRIVKN